MALQQKVRRTDKSRPTGGKRPLRGSPALRKTVVLNVKRTPPVESHRPASAIHSYSQALRFLSTLSDFERLRIVRYNSDTFNLDRMRSLLRKLSNPQDRFRSIYIAGTKGKGSTCAMVAATLQANG